MNADKMRKRLREFVGTRKKVRLTRIVGDRLLHGFLVGIGWDWVLLRSIGDFRSDGYLALRIKDIMEIRSANSNGTGNACSPRNIPKNPDRSISKSICTTRRNC